MRRVFALTLLFTLLLTQAVATAALCSCSAMASVPACQCPDGNGCCGKQQPCDSQAVDVHPDAVLAVVATVFMAPLPATVALLDRPWLDECESARLVDKHPPRIRTPDLANDPLRGPPSFA